MAKKDKSQGRKNKSHKRKVSTAPVDLVEELADIIVDAANTKLNKIDYSKPLNRKQYELFAQHITIGETGKESAMAANYPEKSAYSKGSQLLKIVNIQGRIAYLQREAAEACGVTRERIIAEWARIAFVDIAEIMGPGLTIKNLNTIPRDVRAAIASIHKPKVGGVKITLCSKEVALRNLGEYLGIYEADNRQKAESLAEFLRAMKE